MEDFSAEDLSKIGGIATVSLLHSFIPTRWLPFSIVGRAQKWTLSRTVLVTAFGAVLHVISTSILGITAVTMANTIAGEETVHKLASLLLVILGGSYILLLFTGKGGHSHSHNQPMEKMAVAGLVLVPALSPRATTLPVFLAVGNSSSMMVLAIIVLLFSTITVMTSLVSLSFYGASQLKFHMGSRYGHLQAHRMGVLKHNILGIHSPSSPSCTSLVPSDCHFGRHLAASLAHAILHVPLHSTSMHAAMHATPWTSTHAFFWASLTPPNFLWASPHVHNDQVTIRSP